MMTDQTLGCTRTDENGKLDCKGVANFEGEGREQERKYRCAKCGYVFYQSGKTARGRDTFNLGAPGDKLRDSFK